MAFLAALALLYSALALTAACILADPLLQATVAVAIDAAGIPNASAIDGRLSLKFINQLSCALSAPGTKSMILGFILMIIYAVMRLFRQKMYRAG